jgi:toxin secretion/phage lysis holin
MDTAIVTTKWSVIVKNLSYVPAFIVGIGLSWDSTAILAVLMLVDTFIGVLRSMLLHGGNSFRSRLLAHGIISKMLVLFVPIMVVYVGIGVKLDFLPIARGILDVLILSEAYSILGHIQSIRTRQDVKEFDAISMVLRKLREMLEKMLANSGKP